MGYGLVFQETDMMFSIISIIFFVFIAIFIINLIKGVGQWNKNNNSPKLEVEAVVVAKRNEVSKTRHATVGDVSGAHGYHYSTSTTYFVTFQVTSGDRMEFAVSGAEYGMLTEGDAGKLRFQGTRYLGFEREI